MSIARGCFVLLAVGGCAATKTSPPIAATQPVRPSTAEHGGERPIASDSFPTTIFRSETFEVGSAPIRTIRMNGSMFAASTRAAIASQRPTATLRVRRTRQTDARLDFSNSAEAYDVELDQQPGGVIALGEIGTRELWDALKEHPQAATQGPRLVATEMTIGDVRVVFTIATPDAVRIETKTATAEYDRAGLAKSLADVIATIDTLRERSRNGE